MPLEPCTTARRLRRSSALRISVSTAGAEEAPAARIFTARGTGTVLVLCRPLVAALRRRIDGFGVLRRFGRSGYRATRRGGGLDVLPQMRLIGHPSERQAGEEEDRAHRQH